MNFIKIVFFGTPEFSRLILETLYKSELFEICATVTAPDIHIGRHKQLSPSPVKQYSIEHGIKTYTPTDLKDPQFLHSISSCEVDLYVVAAYGKILPFELLNLKKDRVLNVHPSLLPKYRGASPIQAALINGDTETGVSIIQMDSKMDHGPIVAQRTEFIQPEDNYTSLNNRLAHISADLLVTYIPYFLNKTVVPQPQDHAKASFISLIEKQDGLIDWTESAIEIIRKHRAFCEWPTIYSYFKVHDQKKRITVRDLKISETLDRVLNPGELLVQDNELFIGTADKPIQILALQLEGKNVMDAKTFLNGHEIKKAP